MRPEVKAWLEDIDRSIDEISVFLQDTHTFSEFERDLKTRKAVERNIEIIGEAINRILKVEPGIKISDSRKIVDTRNRIIHGYDRVTADILWLIVRKSLPALKCEVDRFMK
ncbi:MAG: DUF86 domain-containing protein [Bacteroidales bacterium]|nr:DUF86 domain-containing protein [Bacteroidales bacterium]